MVADKAFDQYKIKNLVRCSFCKKIVDEYIQLKSKWDILTSGKKCCKVCFAKYVNTLLNEKKYIIVPLKDN